MEIISLPLEYDKEKIDGKYRLCAIASQRAKELAIGVKPKVQTKSKKVTTVALEESLEDKLNYVTGEEAVIAREKSSKIDYRKLLEESRKAAGEDLSELEKDLKVYLNEKETLDRRTLDELFSERKGEGAEESDESDE